METPTTSFDYFVETFCTKDRNGNLVTTWSFKDHWLKPQGLDLRMSPEDAYKNVWFPRVNKINQDLAFLDVFARKLERLAASGEIECVKSNQSESRYYYKDGFRYRVSGHRYPTGSMTEFVYDDNGNVIGGTIDLIESSAADLVRKYWKENMPRFILQEHATKTGWWHCADTENGIDVTFERHKFNETQQVTLRDNQSFNTLESAIAHARYLREMADWLRANHYNIAMPMKKSNK